MDSYASKSKFYAGFTTAVVASAVVLACCVTDIKYHEPEEKQTEIFLDFSKEEPISEIQQIETAVGKEPRSEIPEPAKPVTLVQRSEAPVKVEAPKENIAPESTIGPDGDVEVPEPEKPKEAVIDKRSLFSSAKNTKKDTSAQQVASQVKDALTAGHTQGNTRTGNPEGVPSAHLEGRSVMGNLPQPAYGVQTSGKVVVKIRVNRNGDVISAIPGAPGTTIGDATIRNAAKKAAEDAKFNVSRDAPEVQEGTITYIFNLR